MPDAIHLREHLGTPPVPEPVHAESGDHRSRNSDPNCRPTCPPPIWENIPEELREIAHWVLWKYSWKPKKDGTGGKWDKPPVASTGKAASTTDRGTWSAFEEVKRVFEAGGYDGVGFVVTDSGYFGLDLDDAIDANGGLEPWAVPLVREFRSYLELSPSGRGLRGFGRGALPPKGRRKKGPIETYDEGRYLTVTGRVFRVLGEENVR